MVISILCGGSGTRLFPLSRDLLPKQFAPILPSNHARSLFQETLLRNSTIPNAIFQIITNESLYFLAKDQAQEIGIAIRHIILESYGKNTAPALAFAALHAQKNYGSEEIILALPSDHVIHAKDYHNYIEQAIEQAQHDKIVTFGIKPSSAHTGYGYIHVKPHTHDVISFTEKPEQSMARHYVDSGEYYWNSGMFCFKARVLLEGLQQHANDIYTRCNEIFAHSESHDIVGEERIRLHRDMSAELRAESIDYALMEKASNITCITSSLSWSDVGSFESLYEEYPKDSHNNATNTHFITKNSAHNFVLSHRPVIAVDVKDFIIIDSDDCLLVSKMGQSTHIKELLPILKESYPTLTHTHRTTYRPWGSYTILLESPSYKIKQIIVKPNARLSLQKHFHRNEHWVVVRGSAIVQIGEKELFLQTNESTYIPMGQSHRLENPGKIPLVIIEVQVGEYLGEDDIVRLADDYARI